MRNADALTPRTGPLGLWDRFVGPGMRMSETLLVIGTAIGGSVAAAVWMHASSGILFTTLVAALLGLDVVGGAVCNATATTKRWYHRPGATTPDHLAFVAPHLLHIAAVAWLLRGPAFDAVYFALIGGWLVASSLFVVAAPGYLKRPVAAALYLGAVALAMYGVGLTPGLEWFAPALFLKLLMGHLVPDDATNS